MTDKTFNFVMRSMPITERLALPDRAELLPKIEKGEIDHLDFRARVFVQGPNRNAYRFREQDMPDLATSFMGQPFQRDHDSTIDGRDGLILESTYQDGAIIQDISLTTRRGMTDYIEGKIDRFSIGWWDYTGIDCNICGGSWLDPKCNHWPGRTYKITETNSARCEITFIQPRGKETSAVSAPAVPGTGIEAALQCKLESISQETQAVDEKNPALTMETGQESEIQKSQAENEMQAHRKADLERLAKSLSYIPQGVVPMNIRELMKKRATCIEQASAIQELAEKESRDLTVEEREQFNGLMDESDALKAQIETIQKERERLSTAKLSLEMPGSEPVKPESSAQNQIKRADFNKLNPKEQARFIKQGGKIED